MAKFTISPQAINTSASTLNGCAKRLGSYSKQINEVKQSLNRQATMALLSGTLGRLAIKAENQKNKLITLEKTLEQCSTVYSKTDKELGNRNISKERISAAASISILLKNWDFDTKAESISKNPTEWKREWEKSFLKYASATGAVTSGIGNLSGSGSISFQPFKKDKWKMTDEKEIKRGEDIVWKDKDGKKHRKKNGKVLKDDGWIIDENGKKINKKDNKKEYEELKYGKKEATIVEAGIEGEVEASLYDVKAGVDGKYGNAHGSVTVGKAEGHASVKGGLYGYDKNGNKIVAPGVEAAIGASFCVLNAKGDAEVGNEFLNAGVEGEVSVGKASAEGTATLSLMGKNGPEAKLSASAEAIAVEAEGSVHGTVAGVEAKVTGSVNIGVGAHADIGVVDGKIKCDIGASLGLGASVSFEIDTKNAVNAVVSQGQALWTKFFG